jgi:Protein of unknown function (DUF2510)
MAEASPGWYPDPGGSGNLRYWNGRKWTSETQPPDPSSLGHFAGPQRRHQRDVLIGWITAVFLPPVGAFIGVRLLKTEERQQAIWMIVLACVVLVLVIVGAATD